jgi:hypothetical protein
MRDASVLARFIADLRNGVHSSNDPVDSESSIALEEEEHDLAAVAIANALWNHNHGKDN